jgi:glucose-6-phosphate 1-epimerase
MAAEHDQDQQTDCPGIEVGGQGIHFETLFGGEVAKLTSPFGSAVVALKGAQVLSWSPAHSGEVLWLSPNADLGALKPARGGIPICWPWFGAHGRINGAPSHGFARTATWTVVAASADTERPALKLALEVAPGARADWGHGARAELTVRLGRELAIELQTLNRGSDDFTLTEALHSYFRVGDIAAATIRGLENRMFVDQLENGQFRREAGEIVIDAEMDRIYQETPDSVVIVDASLKRRITVTKHGSLSTVVWNPWIEKSARLGDLGPDGYRAMLCVETANAGQDAVTLAPGGRHRLAVEIAVEGLD